MYNKKLTSLKIDILILLFISLGYIFLISWDINSWYYSAIGDEYALYTYAKDIAEKNTKISLFPSVGKVSIFLQNGVYNHIPIASSYYQAITMRLLGTSHAGFVASSLIIVVVSFWFYYFYVKDLGGRTLAIFSLFLLSSSHYLWAFIHTGYWNNQIFLPFLASIYFFFKGVKKQKTSYIFLAGIFSGLGFYTYYSSRITIILLSIYLVINIQKFLKQKKLISFLYLGFIFTIAPFIFVNKSTIITQMVHFSLLNPEVDSQSQKLLLFLNNIWISFRAFYSNRQVQHFVSGSLIDPVTAFFFSIGLLFMLIKSNKSYFILIWFLILLLITGGFSSYSVIPITRLFFLLPVIALIAAQGILKTIETLKTKNLIFRLILPIIFLGVFFLNLFRFYFQTPKKLGLTPVATTMRAIMTFKQCKENSLVFFKYYPGFKETVLESYRLTENVQPTYDGNKIHDTVSHNNSCIIFTQPEEEKSQFLIKELENNDLFVKRMVYSPSQNNNVVVFLKQNEL